VDLPYTITKNNSDFFLESTSFRKKILLNGEVGTIYERMQGLMREDVLDLEYALKKVQRSTLADSTPSSN
jgi:hypothetical protein